MERQLICPFCNEKFTTTNHVQVYCCPDHQLAHQKVINIARQKKIIRELDQYRWKTSHVGRLMKFYDVFGTKQQCDLCGITFEDAMDEYGVPLFMELREGIRDWRVMEASSWLKYCIRCYEKILTMKLDQLELPEEDTSDE